MGGAPRIAPGTTADIGRVNSLIVRAIGLATGGRPPNVFPTLARHRGLFRRWLLFAGKLMPGGTLPRAETELVILRVAHNCDCAYEWGHHERLGRRAGLTAQEIERVRAGPGGRLVRLARRCCCARPTSCTQPAPSPTISGARCARCSTTRS